MQMFRQYRKRLVNFFLRVSWVIVQRRGDTKDKLESLNGPREHSTAARLCHSISKILFSLFYSTNRASGPQTILPFVHGCSLFFKTFPRYYISLFMDYFTK